MSNALQPGQQAPDFSLFNTEKNPVKLSELHGKNVLVLFFPMAFTGVCTAELCSTRDNMAMYNDMNATVLGISVDSPFTLGKFKELNELNFDLLSDFNKEISTAYGAIYDSFTGMDLHGVAKRSAFVVDKEGVLRYCEVLENAGSLPNFDAIREVLQGLN